MFECLTITLNDCVSVVHVFQVSEEVGLTSNEDDLDLDLGEDVSIGEKNSSKTPTAEHDFVDEVADKADLPTAINVGCQETSTAKFNPESSGQQDQEMNLGASNDADCKSDEMQSPTCSDSQAAGVSLQMTKSIPGKALAVDSVPVMDSMSDPQDSVKVQSEPPPSSPAVGSSALPVIDSCTTDKTRVLSRPSKKANHSSVSMSMNTCMFACS